MVALNVAALLVAALPVHAVRTAPSPAASASAPSMGVAPTCTNCNVQYWGGPVISNVKIYAVFWGSGVDATVRSGIAGFFTALTNSDWMDWQNEYRTDLARSGGGEGTGQLIGRGTFAGPSITLSPSAAATCTGRSPANPLPDSAIQSELLEQIGAGALPSPDANTLYMLYFPPGCTITSGGASSCVSGGFCAYHGTLTLGARSVFYGVVPDFGPGSGCDLGCGSGTTFQNVCSATSHEVGEAMTDAEVGLASALAPPLAWYDPDNGENGDMCSQATGSITSLADGATYTVQQMYSRRTGFCQLVRTDANDFKVFLNPNAAAIAGGGSAAIPVHTALTAGSVGPLRLALGPLPAGITGAFDDDTLDPGRTTTLRLAASPAALPARDAVVVVTACAGAGTCPSPGVAAHTASLLLQMNEAPSLSLSVAGSASGTVPITASAAAAAGTGLASVSVEVDGQPVGASAASPLLLSWDTTQVINGPHAVVATAVDADGGTRSARADVVVTNDFTLDVDSGPGTAAAGGSPATFTISTRAVGAPVLIALAATGLPRGVRASFDPPGIRAGSSSTLTLTVPANVAPQRVTFTVVGTAVSVPDGHQAKADLSLTAPPSTTGCSSRAAVGPEALALLAVFVALRRRRLRVAPLPRRGGTYRAPRGSFAGSARPR